MKRPVPLPVERVPPETLARLVRELVLREDANDDPGAVSRRMAAALDAVRRGDVRLWFHPDDESVSWQPADAPEPE